MRLLTGQCVVSTALHPPYFRGSSNLGIRLFVEGWEELVKAHCAVTKDAESIEPCGDLEDDGHD